MKKKILYAFFTCNIFILSVINAYCQKSHIKYGKISDEEMNMTVYAKDTTAKAVIIADIGNIRTNYFESEGFEIDFTIHKRVKIFKKEGLDLANGKISLYVPEGRDREQLLDFKGQTYNLENGKQIVSKISRKDVFTEKESETLELKKFALQNVKVGSVIEYEYTVRSPYFWDIPSWYFQDEYPIMWSEYQVSIPEYYSFKKLFGGYIAPTSSETNTSRGMFPGTSESFNNDVVRYVFEDVPAFSSEKYITTPNDYLAKVDFELQSVNIPGRVYKSYLTSWEQIGKDLMDKEYFGEALDRHGMVKDLTAQINLSDSAMKKMKDAYYLIKKNMKWDESYGIYIGKTLRSVSNAKQGSMAEINLLLVNLLRSVGIEAYPVLVSTRHHGRINKFYPKTNSFNSVVALAKINGKNIMMDATIAYLNPGELPYSLLNNEGLMVSKDKVEWVPLLSSEQSYTTTMIIANIKDGKISASLNKATKSLTAAGLRQNIAKVGKEKYIEEYKKKKNDWEISDYTIENEDKASESLNEKIQVNNFVNIDATGDMIYLPAVFQGEIDENPFKSESRKYPVDFAAPIFEKNFISITIPEGYVVEELPKNISLALPENAGSFTYKAQQDGGRIQILCQFKISKIMFLPAEYPILKEFYSTIISKYGEQFVLKKKV